MKSSKVSSELNFNFNLKLKLTYQGKSEFFRVFLRKIKANSKKSIFASSGDNLLICKSKTSLGKVRIIFSDSMVADGLEEGFTGFQQFKSAAPNSSMAPSYEHSSV